MNVRQGRTWRLRLHLLLKLSLVRLPRGAGLAVWLWSLSCLWLWLYSCTENLHGYVGSVWADTLRVPAVGQDSAYNMLRWLGAAGSCLDGYAYLAVRRPPTWVCDMHRRLIRAKPRSILGTEPSLTRTPEVNDEPLARTPESNDEPLGAPLWGGANEPLGVS